MAGLPSSVSCSPDAYCGHFASTLAAVALHSCAHKATWPYSFCAVYWYSNMKFCKYIACPATLDAYISMLLAGFWTSQELMPSWSGPYLMCCHTCSSTRLLLQALTMCWVAEWLRVGMLVVGRKSIHPSAWRALRYYYDLLPAEPCCSCAGHSCGQARPPVPVPVKKLTKAGSFLSSGHIFTGGASNIMHVHPYSHSTWS